MLVLYVYKTYNNSHFYLPNHLERYKNIKNTLVPYTSISIYTPITMIIENDFSLSPRITLSLLNMPLFYCFLFFVVVRMQQTNHNVNYNNHYHHHDHNIDFILFSSSLLSFEKNP